MKRMHIHMSVEDLDASERFYTHLFGTAPSVRKPGYAKWMLDDPRLNFAISPASGAAGVDHLGIQVDEAQELAPVVAAFGAAGGAVLKETATTCCYARSDKGWAVDPNGMRWEAFYTFGEATTYGRGPSADEIAAAQPVASPAGCCG